MSREIKFRAWDNTNNEWLNKEDAECLTIYLDGSYEINRGWAKVFPELTIEQYTGLKDRNGKEICEGDVVRADVRWFNGGTHPRYFSKAIVIFRQQAFMLVDSIEDTTHNEPLWNYASDEVEVIGNIHENPELLGGEE